MSHDNAQFVVESTRRWWQMLGRSYPRAGRLLICAAAGGSDGNRLRAWKAYLQQLAEEIEIAISVCHYPPGNSKWNRIEHRLFSFISVNWRGHSAGELRDGRSLDRRHSHAQRLAGQGDATQQWLLVRPYSPPSSGRDVRLRGIEALLQPRFARIPQSTAVQDRDSGSPAAGSATNWTSPEKVDTDI